MRVLSEQALHPAPPTAVVLRLPSPEAATTKAVLDAFPGHVMLVDERHRVVMVNSGMEASLQKSSDDLAGEPCHRWIHGLDCAWEGCPLHSALLVGRGLERSIHDPETDRHFLTWVQPTGFVTQDGARIHLHGTSDTSTEARAKQQLERQHRTATALARLLVLSAWEGDLETLAHQALRVVFSLPGLDIEDKGSIFLANEDGSGLVMLASVNLADQIRTACARVPAGSCLCGRALQTGQVQHAASVDQRHDIRHPGMSPHGHYCVPIRCDGAILGVLNLYLEDGHEQQPEEEQLLLAVADGLGGILKRKLAEQRLAESEARFRSLAEAAPDAILLLDPSGGIAFSNPAAHATFGYSPADMAAIGHVECLFHERSHADLQAWLAAPASDGSSRHHSSLGQRRDGSTMPIELSVATVAMGGHAHLVLVVRDVTLERELRAVVARGERLASMGTLAAGIAHEIATPLATLRLAIDYLASSLAELSLDVRAPADPLGTTAHQRELRELCQTADDMQMAIAHLERITTSTRSLSRVTDGSRVTVGLDEVARQAMALLRPSTAGRVQIELRLRPTPPVRANVGQLVQVVLNLISNAVHAMEHQPPERALVVVTCQTSGAEVSLEVRDHGPGVPESMRPHLFEPFTTSRPDRGGTGLGLWICDDIVRAHGGRIELDDSVAPGALFRVRLPAGL